MCEYVLELKVSSQEGSDDLKELGEFITEVMNLELDKWGVNFELLDCKEYEEWLRMLDLEEKITKIDSNVNRLSNIDYQTDELCKLSRQIIRRLEHIGHQQELTNNLLITIARSSSKDDMVERINQLIAIEH